MGAKETPAKLKSLSDALATDKKVDISSSKCDDNTLLDEGIFHSFCDEHTAVDLAKHGFLDFPFQKYLSPIPFNQEILPYAFRISTTYKATLEKEIKWCGIEEVSRYYSVAQITAMEGLIKSAIPGSIAEDHINPPLYKLFKALEFKVLTNNHPLQFSLVEGPELQPDIMAGLFTVENNVVHSSIPALDDTCRFLTKIVQIRKARIGHEHLVLPMIVGEYKRLQALNKAEDIAKLFIEMKRVSQMMELIWSNPPKFNFGIYISHTEWRVFIMQREGSHMWVPRLIFHEYVDNHTKKIYAAHFIFVLTDYVKEQLSAVKLVSPQRQEEILDEFRQRAAKSTTIESKALQPTTKASQPTTKPSKATTTKPSKTTTTKPSKPSQNTSGTMLKLYDNIFTTTMAGREVVVKVGSKRKIAREVHCYNRFKGRFFAELLDFATLHNRHCIVLPRYARLPSTATSAGQVLSIARQILTALSTMHECGFIHGDVKNSNIMWDESSNEIKFIDFETAAKVPMTDIVNGYFGTTSYMAPEVRNEQWVSHKSDVFSAGLVIASLIYGIPIKGDEEREKLIGLVNTKTPSAMATAHTISIVSRMLTALPEQRTTATAALKLLTEGPPPCAQPAPVKKMKPVAAKQVPKRTPLGTITNTIANGGHPGSLNPVQVKGKVVLKGAGVKKFPVAEGVENRLENTCYYFTMNSHG